MNPRAHAAPRRRRPRALVWTLTVAAALLVPAAGQARSASGSASAVPSDTRPLVVVRALGGIGPAHLRLACRTILSRYPVRCEIGSSRSLLDFAGAWDSTRQQLDARAALDHLFRSRHPTALVELNLTSVDAYEDEKPFVFGLASLTDRVALVSLARVVDDPDRPAPRAHTRIEKLVLHEVGHAFGLPHHDEASCVMRQDPTPTSLDTAPDRLCQACQDRLLASVRELARPGQRALDRIRGHLVRDDIEAARNILVHALWEEQLDADLLNTYALAFLETGHWNEAISLLDLALKAQPEFAEAHVNRGIALQMRARDGDLNGAIAHFARALELRPGWGSVRAHLIQLRGESAHAQGPRAASTSGH